MCVRAERASECSDAQAVHRLRSSSSVVFQSRRTQSQRYDFATASSHRRPDCRRCSHAAARLRLLCTVSTTYRWPCWPPGRPRPRWQAGAWEWSVFTADDRVDVVWDDVWDVVVAAVQLGPATVAALQSLAQSRCCDAGGLAVTLWHHAELDSLDAPGRVWTRLDAPRCSGRRDAGGLHRPILASWLSVRLHRA